MFNFPYSCINTSTGSCSTPRGVSEQHGSNCLSVSHKESLLSQTELGDADTGQLGPANSTGVLNRLYPQPHPVTPAPTYSPTSGQTCAGDSRGEGTPTETGNSRISPIRPELCFQNISGRKEGGRPTPSNKPESTEPICASGAFQDGGLTPLTRPAPKKGLDDKNGSQRCLSPNPHSPESPTLPTLYMGGEALQIPKPSIWPLLCTTGVYQNIEASDRLAETDRPTPDSVPRRHAIYACQQRPAREAGTTHMQVIRVPGTDGKHTEIPTNSSPTVRILGVSDQLRPDDNQPPTREGQEDSTGCCETPQISINFGTGACHVHRENSGNLQSRHAGSTTLQSPADGTQYGDLRGKPRGMPGQIRVHNTAEQQYDCGPQLVVCPGQTNDEFTNTPPTVNTDNRVRCLECGVGSPMWGHQHGRELVNRRGSPTHQLSGVNGCLPGSQDLCQQPDGIDPLENGQCICSELHQPEGRHTLNSAVQPGSGNMGVVSRETDIIAGRASARNPQHGSRYRIQSNEGSMRLDDQPICIPTNPAGNGSLPNRPICITTDQTTDSVLQLETRPRGRGNRCLHTELGTSEGLCQPSLVSDLSLSEQSKEGRSQTGDSDASVAVPAMVPSTTWNAGGSPSTTPTDSRFNPEPHQSGVHYETGSSKSDRMAHLRESFTSRGISTQASDLLLSSWRNKTNSSYNSHFSKWANWCQQRDRNPTAGPVEDVVNFLADLFKQGYKYNSLNSYRSAISSVHEKVEGQSIGQHPLVSRVLKGAFNEKPPMPRYSHFWDVGSVLRYIKQLGDNNALSLKWISIKTAMLMALTRPSRSADLSKLDIKLRTYTSKGVRFQPSHLSKQSRSTIPVKEFFFPYYAADKSLCPVMALQTYEERTASFRSEKSSYLFLSWIGKHEPVTSSTIARWLRTCLQESGIDTDTFKAHSVRGAACSTAAWSGVTISDILNAADWSSETTFQRFYHKELQDKTVFGSTVLSAANTSNLHVDMETEPSEM